MARRKNRLQGFIALLNEEGTVYADLAETDERTWFIHKINLGKLFMAIDLRDKLYALLGLASDAKLYSAHLDYSEPWEAVYRKFGSLFVEQSHGIELLYQACATSNWNRLPSWIPIRIFWN